MRSDGNELKKTKSSKLDYDVLEDPNLGVRKSMEDYTISEPDLLGDGCFAFFCILDGHGGNTVSKYLKENYSKILKNRIESFRQAYTIPNIIKMSIDNIEKHLQMVGCRDCGSTFCGMLFDLKNKQAWTINIGDSRAMKISMSNGKAPKLHYLTNDHKTENKDEMNRILKQGGTILNGRLAGNLLITRSLGDFDFKKYGLISNPDIEELNFEDGDCYVIASDGVWDVIKKENFDKVLVDLKVGNLKSVSTKICTEAVHLGSTDNISMIIIKV